MDDFLSRQARRQVVIGLAAVMTATFIVLAIVSATGNVPKMTDVRLSWGWLAASLLMFLAFQPLIVEVWRRLLREAGGSLRIPRAHAIYNVSLLMRYVPTQVLMALSRIELAHREGVPRSVSVAALAYEFALSVGTAFAVSVSFVLSLDSLQGHPARYLVLFAPVVVLLLLHPRVIDVLETKAASRFGVVSEHVTIPLRRLVPYLLTYLVIWVIAGLGVYCLARGIHVVGPPHASAITSYAVGYAAAVVAVVLPAGLGVRDIATATALSATIPFSVAVAASVAVRLLQTAIEIAYAGATAIWARQTAPAPNAPLN